MKKTMKAIAVLMLSMVVVFAAGCKTQKIKMTPEEKLVSKGFSANKGKLPWPVEKGFVSSPFGEQPSPISKQITINNNGIDITTEENAIARCVFDGEVALVSLEIPHNKAVIVRHGDYYTAYSELDEVYVKKGDKVKAKQDIGRVHTGSDKKTVLHFEMTKGRAYLDPQDWLARLAK